ncbi:MAG: glutamate--tRNA ligase [Deltaproteobacteria bacterium]|nr:glutamate--tRNA ligase [Deltaproteobacteria bacterium]MBW2676798.1 glutamate--tRNA ligase [Deltaproteobacteria bacterium]
MSDIITRFPPSPTGHLHVGGARTALFNWLYARHTHGKFVLRIEDTDTARSTQASVDAIFEALEWLGIEWDEGPYFQTQRFDIYKEYLQKLIHAGHAYYCTCSSEKVEAMRARAMETGAKPKYDGTCREKNLPKTDDAVVRFKAPLSGTTVLKDVVKGNIVFQNDELDDYIICRSDGTPTYNFVVVIDDITMHINTIIRGDDHVMNTPKQMLIYKALDVPLPVYGHVPMVLGSDRTRLSKRHGATSVTAYRDLGFLPDAFINYLVRLGWSHGDQEFFTRDALVEKFSLENIGRSAGVFDQEKLLALNAEHIKATPVKTLATLLIPFLKKEGIEAREGVFIEGVIKTLVPRSKTLKEMARDAIFYYADTIEYEEKAARKFLKDAALEPLNMLIAELQTLDTFTEKNLEDAFRAVMEKSGLKLGKIAQPVRVALTGRTASPGIFEIIEIIGKDTVLERLIKAVDFINAKPDSTGKA